MGLDGFSMGNLGLHRDLTSAQMSNNAEVLATKGGEFKVKGVAELGSEKGIERREEGFSGGGGSFESNFKDEEEQKAEDEARALVAQQNFEKKDPKDFSVRINPETDMVELYNNNDRKIIETISAKDLMVLISKLDSASGILVNRKI